LAGSLCPRPGQLGVKELRRPVEKKTLLSGDKYLHLGHKMSEILERVRHIHEGGEV